MRNLIIYLCTLLSLPAFSQPKDFKELNDLKSFEKSVSVKMSQINSIRYAFEQEKKISMLSDKALSYGSIAFVKPDKLRMEYTKPYSYLMVMNDKKVQVKSQEKTSNYNTQTNKFFRLLTKIVTDCVQGNVVNNSEFQTKVFAGPDSYLVKLTPLNKELKSLFKTISVYIDKDDLLVSQINLDEISGDNTTIRFTNKAVNVKVPLSDFTIN